MSILEGGDKLSEKDLSDFRNEAENVLFNNCFDTSNSLQKNNFFLSQPYRTSISIK